jgi:hypothetical protein
MKKLSSIQRHLHDYTFKINNTTARALVHNDQNLDDVSELAEFLNPAPLRCGEWKGLPEQCGRRWLLAHESAELAVQLTRKEENRNHGSNRKRYSRR